MPLTFQSLDEAIAKFEGFGKTGTPATRNNNPGNIIASDFAYSNGAIGESGGFAVFPDPATGYAATDALVGNYAAKGATLESLIKAWSPGNAPGNTPQSTQNYIDYVSTQLGVTGTTKVSDLAAKPGTGTTTTNTSSSIMDKIDAFNNTVGDIVTGKFLAASWGRVGAFAVGLLFIAAGLFLFKPTQQIIQTGIRVGTKVAEL